MANAIQSVLGMFKSLLPLGSGDTLPIQPKLPDFSAFLDNMMAVLQGILGTSPDPAAIQAPPPAAPSPAPSAPSAPLTISPPTNPSSMALLKSGSGRSGSSDPKSSAPPAAPAPPPQDGSSPALSAAAVSAQIEQIRGLVQRLQKGSPGDPSAQPGVPKQAISDLAQALVELKKQILAAGQGPALPASLPAPTAAPEGAPVSPALPAAALSAPTPGPAQGGLPVLGLSPKSAGGDALSLPSSQTPLSLTSPLGVGQKEGLAFDAALDQATSSLRASGDEAAVAIPQGGGLPLVTAIASGAAGAQEAALEPKSDLALPGAAAPGRSGADRPSGPLVASGSAEAPTPEERAEFVEELVKAVRLTQSRGNARIKLDLSPPNLGTLKMDLSVRQHVLTGTFQADNAAAGEMLLSHLPSLRQSLESQGIQVGDFQVQVNQSFQQAPQNGSDPGPSRGESQEAKGTPEDPSVQARDRIRSARLQMIDYVA